MNLDLPKVFIGKPPPGAGIWIYRGYEKAWESFSYTVSYYKFLTKEMPIDKNSILMVSDYMIAEKDVDIFEKFSKVFLFAQPTHFPAHWGTHPNFISRCSPELIGRISKMPNVFKWTFLRNAKFHTAWGNVFIHPLAFDSLSYNRDIARKNHSTPRFNVCFIGSSADNGFNEKQLIIQEVFNAFEKAGIEKLGFFVNQNLSHEEENAILWSSKISLNIHDAYQRFLKLDTNERTFKSMGTTGILVSDEVTQIKDCFGSKVFMSRELNSVVSMVRELLELPEKDLVEMKEKNREYTNKFHTYEIRVREMLKWTQ